MSSYSQPHPPRVIITPNKVNKVTTCTLHTISPVFTEYRSTYNLYREFWELDNLFSDKVFVVIFKVFDIDQQALWNPILSGNRSNILYAEAVVQLIALTIPSD